MFVGLIDGRLDDHGQAQLKKGILLLVYLEIVIMTAGGQQIETPNTGRE